MNYPQLGLSLIIKVEEKLSFPSNVSASNSGRELVERRRRKEKKKALLRQYNDRGLGHTWPHPPLKSGPLHTAEEGVRANAYAYLRVAVRLPCSSSSARPDGKKKEKKGKETFLPVLAAE